MLGSEATKTSHCYMLSWFEEVKWVCGWLLNFRQASGDAMQKAEELKNEGNHAFFSRDLAKAVSFYSQALCLNPTSATLHTNRLDVMCACPRCIALLSCLILVYDACVCNKVVCSKLVFWASAAPFPTTPRPFLWPSPARQHPDVTCAPRFGCLPLGMSLIRVVV